jgi:hypothetical protein
MRLVRVLAAGLLAIFSGAAADGAPRLTAEQIVAKNVAARGGLEAWRNVETLVCIGHLRSERAPLPSMGFILEQKRPNRTRFELLGMNQKSVRVFDGRRGWKMNAGQNDAQNPQPFSRAELMYAQRAPGLSGPLVDYAAQGSHVTLEGVEQLKGRDTYRLAVQRASGELDHVWVDAKTFLDARYDRPSPAGPSYGPVSVYYSDYRAVAGVQVAAIIETNSSPGHPPDKMTIERMVVNSPLEDRVFTVSGGSMSPGSPRLVPAPLPVVSTPSGPTEPTPQVGGTAEPAAK